MFSDDYDQLSDLGVRQSQRIGQHWADTGVHLDHVFVGPRRRHVQTMDAALGAFQAAGGIAPDPVEVPELDEYQVDEVVRTGLPALMAEYPDIAELAATVNKPGVNRMTAFQKLFERVTRMWVRQEIQVDDGENWQAFRERVARGLDQILERFSSGQTGAAFTSGGPVSVISAAPLDLADERVLELSWMVRNGAWTEIVFGNDRLSLQAFGAIPHLQAADLQTWR